MLENVKNDSFGQNKPYKKLLHFCFARHNSPQFYFQFEILT